MVRQGVSIVAAAVVLGACSGDPGPPPDDAPLGPAERSEVVFQAVDAGTGGALNDTELTVRYLVRSPIVLDASDVVRVPSAEPYHIAQSVAADSLVVELRLEAGSYHRLDTVLSVARGATTSPFTVRMARRLERAAQAPPRPTPTTSAPAARPSPSTAAPAAAAAAVDRAPLEAGNRAFAQGNWLAAIEAFSRMTPPADRSGDYAGAFALALVNRGIAHMNRGEFGAALESLEDAAEFDPPGWEPAAYLAQAQCAVGRSDEGLGSLAILARQINRMQPVERPVAEAMTQYSRGVCGASAFDRAGSARERISTGAQAIRDLQAFITAGEAVSTPVPALTAALTAAKARIELIQGRMRGGGF